MKLTTAPFYLQYCAIPLTLLSLSGALVAQTYQAESAQLSGVYVRNDGSGYSGSGFVSGFDANGDAVTFNINVTTAAFYQLKFGGRTPSGEKWLDLRINGSNPGIYVSDVSYKLFATSNFTEMAGPTIWLKSGSNAIRIEKGWGFFDLDYIKLVGLAARPALDVSPVPVSAWTTPEAKTLLAYLADGYGAKILSGQQIAGPGLSEVSAVESMTGKSPAILGLDYLFYTAGYYAPNQMTENAIDWYKNRNGIVTFCWHWRAPMGGASFYSNETTFNVERVIIPGTAENVAAIKDIDMIAVELKRLKSAGVPVIWRPLHEAEGGWFWWGAKGAEPCKQLYRMVYDRLVHHHELKNLIWVWNSLSPAWHPGDQYVDIVSGDYYSKALGAPFGTSVDALQRTYGPRKKMLAMSENGAVPDAALLVQQKAHWRWFCTWNGFLNDTAYNDPTQVRRTFNDAYVITRDELPYPLRNYAPQKLGGTFYQNEWFGGYAVTLAAGDYRRTDLESRGIRVRDISSLTLSASAKAVLFSGDNLDGASVTISSDNGAFSALGWNDRAASIRITR